MKTLGGSYFKFFPSESRGKETEFGLNKQDIVFLGNQKRVRAGFSVAVSFQCQHKCVNSICAASYDLPSSEAQANDEIEELQTIYTDEPKTVRVKFKLQKECAFGHEFFIVGDDPIIGLWDPSDGVRLNWSDGHVWTAELDIPRGKEIKYKFILKEDVGTISWQPGPDRILQTWDTENTIIVVEDWDNPELQNIAEGKLSADISEKVLVPVIDKGTDLNKELTNTNGNNDLACASVVGENTVDELGEQNTNTSDRGSDLLSHEKEKGSRGNDYMSESASNLLSLEDERDPIPVLVPGLIPMPPEDIEEELVNEVETDNTTSDEDEELAEPELKENELATASLNHTETIDEESIDMNEQHYINDQLENNVFEEDIQWGRRTLQKFLANFGFQVSS